MTGHVNVHHGCSAKMCCLIVGLVEVCKVVGATYHKRLLPSGPSGSQRERLAIADTTEESSQTHQNIYTPPARTSQLRTSAPAAAGRTRGQEEVSDLQH
jgi:hypothetical protein